jgi:hypothetical protein
MHARFAGAPFRTPARAMPRGKPPSFSDQPRAFPAHGPAIANEPAATHARQGTGNTADALEPLLHAPAYAVPATVDDATRP